jgi:hypothetical protein
LAVLEGDKKTTRTVPQPEKETPCDPVRMGRSARINGQSEEKNEKRSGCARPGPITNNRPHPAFRGESMPLLVSIGIYYVVLALQGPLSQVHIACMCTTDRTTYSSW